MSTEIFNFPRSFLPALNNPATLRSKEQANELIDIFEKERNRQIITRHDRDFPSRFIVQLLMKEAQLWKLGFGLLKNRARGKQA